MGWSAAAAIGGALIASDAQSSAADTAANATSEAAAQSNETSKYIYDQTRADQKPWRDAGVNALSQMVSGMGSSGTNGELTRSFGMGDFQADPGYQFRLAEGEKALRRTAAAGGRLYSGRAQKDLARFNSGLASDEYGAAYNRFQSDQTSKFNRLASVAGLGQTANNALAQAGQNYGASVGNNLMTAAGNTGTAALVSGMGNASAYTGIGNTIGRAIASRGYGSTSSTGSNPGAYDSSTWNW